jgi:spermidine synthase
VLVIGGGDGGVMREVLKHPSVEKATLVEIDRSVVDLSLEHYPEIAGGAFDDPRCDLVIADGLKFVAETKEKFDAIIVDSSEPIGPSAVLHSREFFSDCRDALKEGGIFVTQNGLPFVLPEHLGQSTRMLGGLFKRVAPYTCTQPCYFGGPFALNWASEDPAKLDISAKKLARRQEKRQIKTRYWTPGVHVAAFALPAYIQKVVDAALLPEATPRPRRRPKLVVKAARKSRRPAKAR